MNRPFAATSQQSSTEPYRFRYVTGTIVSFRTNTFSLLAVAIVAAGTVIGAEPRTTGTWQSDADHAWQSARTARRPLLLYFTMTNCVHCRKMARETLADQSVASDIETKFIAASLTADKDGDLARRLGVRIYPTTVIVAPEAGVLDRISGYVGPTELRDRLRVAAEKASPLKR